MRVTLREVAKQCGCSVPSASRALKDDPNISRELKAKARKAAKELGYIPDAIAESMRTGQTKTIAVILQDLLNPYFSIIAHKIERYASNRGLNSIIITTDYSAERELSAVYTALGKNVDGVIFLPVQQDTEGLQTLVRSRTPFILVHRYFENLCMDCIRPDDRMGAYQVVRHLVEKGHRRILFVNSFDYISSSRLREEGYRAAIHEGGIRLRKRDIIRISTSKGECAEVIQRLFSGKSDYTAIFCYCDSLAFEAYQALSELDVSIPDDVALAGVDDLNHYVTYPIKLTSAGYDMQALAEQSVDLLMEKIEHKRGQREGDKPWEARLILLPEYLVRGRTT